MSLARLTRCIPVPLILSVSCQLAYANNYYDPALLHSFDDAPDITSTEEIQSTMLKEGVSHLHVFINGDKSVSVQREPSGHNLMHPTKWCTPNSGGNQSVRYEEKCDFRQA